MKQSGWSFIPIFALIKLLLTLAAFTCLLLSSPWRSLHPLSPRQHKLRDLESGVGWQEEERDLEIEEDGQTLSRRERDGAKQKQKKNNNLTQGTKEYRRNKQ